jgi:hypothetical protein
VTLVIGYKIIMRDELPPILRFMANRTPDACHRREAWNCGRVTLSCRSREEMPTGEAGWFRQQIAVGEDGVSQKRSLVFSGFFNLAGGI